MRLHVGARIACRARGLILHFRRCFDFCYREHTGLSHFYGYQRGIVVSCAGAGIDARADDSAKQDIAEGHGLGPCKRELPILEGAQKVLGKEKLVVLAVNFHESPDTIARLASLAKTWQLSLLEDRNGFIASHYKITGIPHMFLIDRDGKIVANHTGYGDRSLEELVADLNKALRPTVPADEDSSPPLKEAPTSDGTH
jgi:Thioredoxin-like